jgi:SPX domain/EXS family
MVAFGAKLLDNQVSEWSEHYLDYEKLKDILSKISTLLAKLDELREKKPELVDAIVEHRLLVGSPHSSQLNLSANPAMSQLRVKEVAVSTSTATTTYGSMDAKSADNARSFSTPQDASPLLHVINRATSGVSDFFVKSFEKSVHETVRAIDTAEEEFDVLMKVNLTRVNSFYDHKLDELNQRVAYLKESAAQLQKNKADDPGESQNTPDYQESPLIQSKTSGIGHALMSRLKLPGFKHREPLEPVSALLETLNEDSQTMSMPKGNIREAESIQRALEDHYRSATLLHNYVVMNYTGFVKIVKKFDKTLTKKKGKYKVVIQKENICDDGRGVEALIARMEVLYANWFCDRNINAARAQMLTKRNDGLDMDWSQLRLGYRMGMCSILGLWVFWDCIWGLLSEGMSTIGGRTAFPVFRACAGLVMLQWCWGFSVWVWNRYRVNYIFLFDFDPSTVEGPLDLFNHAVNNTLVYMVCTLLYYKAGAHDIPGRLPPGVFPVILVIYGIVQLVYPWRRRGPMWQAIFSVITAPSSPPSFFHGYVGTLS